MWSFLSQIGNLGKTIGSGIKTGVQKVGQGIGQLGGEDDDSGDEGGMTPTFRQPKPPMATPAINPSAQSAAPPMPEPQHYGGWTGGIRRKLDEAGLTGGGASPTPQSEQPQAVSRLQRVLFPSQTMPAPPVATSTNMGAIPTQIEPPALPQARFAYTGPDQVNRGEMWSPKPAPAMIPDTGAAAIQPAAIARRPDPNDDYHNVPIPALPGNANKEPTQYNAMDKARYDYVMQGARKNEDGSYLDPTDKAHGGGFKRSWKDIGMNALSGFIQGQATNPNNRLAGGLAGAGTAATIGAISPQTGREYNFESIQAPGIRQQEAEQKQRDQEAYEKQTQQAKLGQVGAEVEGIKARTAATIAGTKDAAVERAYRIAQSKKLEAAAEAQSRIKPMYRDLVVGGKVGTYEIVPGQEPRLLGGAEKAYLTQQGILSKEKIAAQSNATKTGIAAANNATKTDIANAQEAGKTERATSRTSAASKEALKDAKSVEDDRQTAMTLWNQSKREKDPAKKAQLEAKARDAQESYNAASQWLVENYPDTFEGGMGKDNWHYNKRKGGGRAVSSRAGISNLVRDEDKLPPLN